MSRFFGGRKPSSGDEQGPTEATDPPANPPSFKTNVNRQKTKRWVEAKSYSYDGDDWGSVDEYNEYSHQEPIAQPAHKPTGLRQRGYGLGSAPASSDAGRVVSGSSSAGPNPVPETRFYSASGQPRPPIAASSSGPPAVIHQDVPTFIAPPGSEDGAFAGAGASQVSRAWRGPAEPYDTVHSLGHSSTSQEETAHGSPSAESTWASRTAPFYATSSSPTGGPGPPPLDTAPGTVNLGHHPPRLSSLTHSNPPGAELTSPASPIEERANTTLAESTSAPHQRETSQPIKPRPFIRPADIYKRMEEERDKERRSLESERRSVDSARSRASDAEPFFKGATVQKPLSLDSAPYLAAVDVPRPSSTKLDPVRESPSDPSAAPSIQHSPEGDRSRPSVDGSHAGTDERPLSSSTRASLLSVPGTPGVEKLLAYSAIPILPDVARLSGFGDAFYAVSDLGPPLPREESPPTPTITQASVPPSFLQTTAGTQEPAEPSANASLQPELMESSSASAPLHPPGNHGPVTTPPESSGEADPAATVLEAGRWPADAKGKETGAEFTVRHSNEEQLPERTQTTVHHPTPPVFSDRVVLPDPKLETSSLNPPGHQPIQMTGSDVRGSPEPGPLQEETEDLAVRQPLRPDHAQTLDPVNAVNEDVRQHAHLGFGRSGSLTVDTQQPGGTSSGSSTPPSGTLTRTLSTLSTHALRLQSDIQTPRTGSPSRGKVRDLADRFEDQILASTSNQTTPKRASFYDPTNAVEDRTMQRPPLPPSELTFRPSLPGGWISSSTIGRDSSQTSNSDREIPRSFPPLDVITAGAEATEASDGGEVVDAHSDTGELSKGAAVKRQEETAASQPGQERAIAGGAASTFPVRSSLAAPDATGVRNLGNAPDDRPPPGNDDLPPPPPPKDSPAEKVSYEAQTRPSKIPPSEAGNIPPGNSSDDVAQDDLPTPVPLSTDASPFDEESDRLRKEIVRSLNAPAFSNPSVVTSHPGQAPRESFQMLADAKQPGLERESSIFPSEYDSYWASDHDTPRLAVPGITMGKEREGLVGDVTENLPIPLSVDAEGRGQSHDRQLDPNLGYDAQKRDGGSTVDHPIKAVPHEVHSPQEHEDEAYPGAVESTASAELDQSSSEASTTVVPGHLGSEAPLPHLRTEDDKAPAAEAPPAESTPEDQKQLRPDNFGVSPSSSVSVGDRHDLGIQHFDADTGRLAAPDAPTTETNQEANLQATTPTSSSTAQDSPDTGAQTTHLNSGNLHELIRFTEAEPMLIHASIPQMSSSDKRSRDRDSAPPPDDSLLETVRLAESPPLHIQPPGSATEEVAPPSAEPKSAPRDNGPPSERFPVEARSTRLAAALPASALRVPTTQDIAVMPTALERIQAYDRVRKHHANLSTGLAAWLAARTTKEPARGGVVPSTSAIPRLDTSAPASDSAPSTPTARPATDTSPAGSSTADQPYYQQYLHFSDYPPASGAAKISPTTTGTGPAPSALYAGSSTNKITAGQVQAKGKELLHSAGVLGGKANVAAKGFFAKGKSKWRASTADKVDH